MMSGRAHTRAECQGMVRIGTPRRRLRGVLVFLLLASSVASARSPVVHRGDCAILGAEAPPFEAGDLVTIVDAKEGKARAVWASSLQRCSKPENISGWLPSGIIAKATPSPALILHETPGGAPKGRLSLS